jgi:hypothetical protein
VSPATDWGYEENRAWVVTQAGPALCGRAGEGGNQYLVCTVWANTGWRTVTSTPHGDWGFPENRAWVSGAGGVVSYCRLVGDRATSKQLRCESFNGTTWSAPSVSPATDWGYEENRAWVSTQAGPALCGRAGEGGNQYLVCTVWANTGWRTVTSTPHGDWGFPENRAWVQQGTSKVAYCRLVGDRATSPQLRCESFNGTKWSAPSVSPATDWGYPETFG